MNESMNDPSHPAAHKGDSADKHPAKLHVDLRELSRDESLDLLNRHHVGHVAVSFHDLVRLKLCNYIYSEGWIYARTEVGADVTMAKHHPWAAFEVYEAESIYDWRSVEVSGAVEFLSSDMQSGDWFRFETAVRLLRTAVPQVLTADDPMPQRVQLLRIHVDMIVGRQSSSGTPGTLPAA
jgi:nitroimidazol reductase NimA-like FMN-containing flavoprotein (pyridoxamine 5'-phosphate oxidase superfamily)